MKFSQHCFIAAAFLGVLVVTGVSAADALPDLKNRPYPQPEPVAPDGWDVFTPPITSAAPASAAPAIAEWTRTDGPDDTLILTGDKLSNFSGVDEGKDTRFSIYSQTIDSNGARNPALIQRLDGAKSAITLPASLPSWSLYLLWPGNSAGYGYPVAINGTDAWWLNPDDKVTRGDTVAVFGRNLAHDGGTAKSWIYLKPAGNVAGTWAAITSVNPYRVEFTVPNGLTNGAYEVWVHNGHGGSYGWSGPLSLTISDRYQWNGSVFNVKDYGATGNGTTDDTGAIMAAHSAAIAYRDRSGSPATLHPTLYFPSGTYMMNQGISLKHDLRYTGDGKTLTTLRCNGSFQHTSEQGLLYGERNLEHDIEVSNLTLDANGHFAETSFPYDYLVSCTFIPQWTDLRFSNVRIQVPNPGNRVSAMSFGPVSRLTISGCEIDGGTVMLMNGTHVAIDRCSFLFSNDLFTGIYCQSVNGVSITGSNCADRDINSETGQGLGRFIILGGYLGSQRNVYIGGNQTVACAPRPGAADQNTGEQILSEGNVVRYESHPASSTPEATTFSTLPIDQNQRVSQTAVIVAGKGLGQTRPITGINYGTKTITVNPAWNVTPDSTSLVQIAWTTDRCVIYRNAFDGKNDYATRVTASSAIEAYGGCNEWIGDGNTISHVRYAIYLAGLVQYSPDPIAATEPCSFHYYANNLIQHCHRGCFVFADTPMDPAGVPLTSTVRMGSLGNTFRANQWSDITSAAICLDGAVVGLPVDMAVFEHNILTDLPEGVNFYSNGHHAQVVNTVLYKNSFTRGTAPLASSVGALFIASTFAPVLNGNTWSGFQANVSGTLPGDILELPVRTYDLTVPVNGPTSPVNLTILNSGTSPLLWNAASDSAWLTLSAASGTVQNERSSSLTMTCSPGSLAAGIHLGTVVISTGEQTKKVTVSLEVKPVILPPQQVKIISTVIPAIALE